MTRAFLLAVLLLPACTGWHDQHPSEWTDRKVEKWTYGGGIERTVDRTPNWPATTK